MNTLQEQFDAARRTSTPLLAISSPDIKATEMLLKKSEGRAPLVSWDALTGLFGLNDAGTAALMQCGDEVIASYDASIALKCAVNLPRESVLFMHNAHRVLDTLSVVQGVANLRDIFKRDFRTLVMLGASFTLPAEIANDVVLLEEQLPSEEQLRAIIAKTYTSAQTSASRMNPPIDIPSLDDETIARAVAAMSGVSAFGTEQATAMCIRRDGLDIEELWGHKRSIIQATPGLSVWRGNERFDDIGGLDNIKTFLSRLIDGPRRPRVIVFADEIDKTWGGSSSDSSGVSQDQLGTTLSAMQDNAWTGFICIGPPGTSKSVLAKAAGNEAGVPTIALDLGAMKDSLVGNSEKRIRDALAVIKAIAGEHALFIATCNSLSVVPPEMRRRYGFGTYFFDLPTASERRIIWAMYAHKYGLDCENGLASDTDWTGAEIRQCCDIAHSLQCSIEEAARYIVPVAKSASEQIKSLRKGAHGRYLSASHSGIYEFKEERSDSQSNEAHSEGRAFSLPGRA